MFFYINDIFSKRSLTFRTSDGANGGNNTFRLRKYVLICNILNNLYAKGWSCQRKKWTFFKIFRNSLQIGWLAISLCTILWTPKFNLEIEEQLLLLNFNPAKTDYLHLIGWKFTDLNAMLENFSITLLNDFRQMHSKAFMPNLRQLCACRRRGQKTSWQFRLFLLHFFLSTANHNH